MRQALLGCGSTVVAKSRGNVSYVVVFQSGHKPETHKTLPWQIQHSVRASHSSDPSGAKRPSSPILTFSLFRRAGPFMPHHAHLANTHLERVTDGDASETCTPRSRTRVVKTEETTTSQCRDYRVGRAVSFIPLAPADRCHIKKPATCPARGAETVVVHPSVTLSASEFCATFTTVRFEKEKEGVHTVAEGPQERCRS